MRPTLLALFLGFATFAPLGAVRAESLDEAVIHVKVRAALLEHFGTDALGIEIQVNGGNVALSGTVDKTTTKEQAKQAALTVKGVASVENRTVVGAGPATKAKNAAARARRNFSNALLEAKVKGRLFEQVGENALKVKVEARQGVITLTGALPTAQIRATALDTVKGTNGVARVVDHLSVG